jgi:regulator of protease activity HflC (stomatin/prohibitin superfamily)
MDAYIDPLLPSRMDSIIALLVVLLVLLVLFKGIKVVPQSNVFVIERFGKYVKTLNAGLNLIVPFLDRIAHRVSILERQLPEFKISVITRDNVEVELKATVFYRIVDAASSVYRIRQIDRALHTAQLSNRMGNFVHGGCEA